MDTKGSDLYAQCLEQVQLLLAAHAILSCHVHDGQSRTPRFARGVGSGAVTAGEIVQLLQQDGGEDITIEDVLSQELQQAGPLADMAQAPLWSVKVRSLGTSNSSLVSLTTHHVLNDGRGSAALFRAILSNSSDDAGLDTSLSQSLPPVSDSFLPIRPSWSYMVPIVFQELIVPRLPLFLRPYFLSKPSWPTTLPIRTKPLMAPKRLRRVSLFDAVPRLKRLGNVNGVKTINTIVHTAAAVASYIVADAAVQLDSSTAISERGFKEGLPSIGGNFVSSVSVQELRRRQWWR